jgi:hypothetical protein
VRWLLVLLVLLVLPVVLLVLVLVLLLLLRAAAPQSPRGSQPRRLGRCCGQKRAWGRWRWRKGSTARRARGSTAPAPEGKRRSGARTRPRRSRGGGCCGGAAKRT